MTKPTLKPKEMTLTLRNESRAIAPWMQALFESDQDLFAQVLRLGVQTLMEAERDEHVSAGQLERSGERTTERNGYQARRLRTRVGVLDVKVPKTRDGAFCPSILERYRRSEAALMTTLVECYVQGVSTRKASGICEERFGDLSHETVRCYTSELEREMGASRERPLEGDFPYVLMDAGYEKARGSITELSMWRCWWRSG